MIKTKVIAVITSGNAIVPPNTHGMVDLKTLEAMAVWLDSRSNTDWIVLFMAIAGSVRKSSTRPRCDTRMVFPQYGHLALAWLSEISRDAPQVGHLKLVVSDNGFLRTTHRSFHVLI